MRNKTISAFLTVFLLISAGSQADTEQEGSALQIYLPREITIEGNVLNLGQVAIIRGEECLTAKAERVTLGRISAPGQKIIVDRSIVLSRLACSGIPASEVTLSGAERVTVSQQHQIIKGGEFVEKALAFLKKNPPKTSIFQYAPIRIPKNLILPDIIEDIRFSPRHVKGNIKSQAKVFVSVFSGDKEIGAREIAFSLKYNCRRLITQVDIPKGAAITPENVKVEKVISDYPEPTNWIVPYGFVTKRRLPANTVISTNMVGPVKPPILLKRNQNVVIKVDRLGLFITAIGKTMQDGRVGEYIKVRNMDSQRIIMAKVNKDGSVEPIF
ncbi:MAG: flagellar basal body P-ring formation chaperone FlgA [Planctomycetota bacterium]|jgi:flagella basal body P-ring formation protein FlgA